MCLVKRNLQEASIIVHTTENNQSTTINHIFDVPFIEHIDVKYVHNCKRASTLVIPSFNKMKVERNNCHKFSTLLTQVMIMDMLRENDVTIIQSRLLKRQKMLWLITNDIPNQSLYSHSITDNENDTASLKCQRFSIRRLNKSKSVSVTVFMVPHDALLTILPQKHCFDYVYCGPDEAMMHRDVIKIGKRGIHAFKFGSCPYFYKTLNNLMPYVKLISYSINHCHFQSYHSQQYFVVALSQFEIVLCNSDIIVCNKALSILHVIQH